MYKRVELQFAVTAMMIAAMLGNTNCILAKSDECPRLILTVVCASHSKKRCCPGYIAEAAGHFGRDVEGLRFDWSVSNGRIIQGQGSPIIRFETSGANGKPIEVKLRVEGLKDWPNPCAKELTLTIDYCKDREKSART